MYRDFKAVSPETFRKALLQQNLESLESSESPEEALRIFQGAMSHVVENVFPLKRVKKNKKKRPWRSDPEEVEDKKANDLSHIRRPRSSINKKKEKSVPVRTSTYAIVYKFLCAICQSSCKVKQVS